MVVFGVILLVVAAVALLVARSQGGQARAATATETLSCADLTTLSQGVESEVGGGGFHQRCEVVGRAAAGESGLVKAPESGVEAVWHRTRVTHRYWEMQEERDAEGHTSRNRVEREDTVSDISSAAPFFVEDGSGQVAIVPEGADVDRPERVLDRFEPYSGGGGPPPRGLAGVVSSVLRASPDSGTLGFHHQEWIIRPGAQLYVQGEASDASGRLAFAKPANGNYLISTRSEEQIVASARSGQRIGTIVGAVAGAAGVVLLVIGLLA